MPERRWRPLLVGALAVTLAATGCGNGGAEGKEAAAPAARQTPARAASAAPTAAPAPATTRPAPVPTVKPGETDGAGLVVPPTTAGDLDAQSVPQAPDLGRGWTRYVDPGDVAEGYTGNGSWVRARGAAEVVQAVVPLGCAGLASPPVLPVPKHALEATYRGPKDAPGVALVLDYRNERQATRFLTGMARIARSCPAPAERVTADAPLTVVVEPVRVAARTVLDRRREYGVGASEWVWSEVVVQRGSRVGLLILATPPSAPGPDLARMAERLRAAVPR